MPLLGHNIKRSVLSTIWGPKFFSKAKILSFLSHTSCLDNGHDILNDFVETPNSLLLEGGNHDNMGLSHEFYCINDVYTNVIQAWIDEACSGACHFWHDFYHAYGFMFYSNHNLMEIPTCMYFTFDVSLFWMMTKHKGISHGIDEMLRWLHWIYDFT